MFAYMRQKPGFYRQVLFLATPIILQNLITSALGMADTFMVGMLGEAPMAAVTLANIPLFAVQMFIFGVQSGSSVLISQYWGKQEMESINRVLGVALWVALLVSSVCAAVLLVCPVEFLSLFGNDFQVIELAARYGSIAGVSYVCSAFTMMYVAAYRSMERPQLGMYILVASMAVNTFLNWVFIFGKLGAPAMGVAGAALGTLISRCFEFSAICGYFFLIEKGTRYRVRDILSPCKNLTGEFLRISLPVMVSDTLLGLGTSVTMSVAGHISDIFVSAYTITQVTQQITTVFTAALGQSAVIITGNTLGKGDPERAQQQGITFTVLGFVLGTLCGAVIVLISPLIVGSYNILPETHAVALELMRAVGIITIFMTPANILTKGVLRGGGDTRFLMLADVVFLWAMSVPLGYLAGLVWCWPPFWVFFCLRLDHVIKAVWCVFRLKSGKWIKKIRTNSETV